MRYRAVIDMHFVNRMQAFGWPLLIFGFALVVVLAIGMIVGSISPEVRAEMYDEMVWSGAIFALLGPLIGYGFVAMSHYFPLALGLGLTRREFAVGLSSLFLINALGYSVLITVGKVIEVATGGFGVGVRFFNVHYTGTGPAWQTLIQSFLLIATVLFLGAAITAAFLRFGQGFLWIGAAVCAALAVLLVGGIVMIDGFGPRLLEMLMMDWGPWMAILAVTGLALAGIWLVLVRRTQVR